MAFSKSSVFIFIDKPQLAVISLGTGKTLTSISLSFNSFSALMALLVELNAIKLKISSFILITY
ncbi:hypothetical protein D3C81_1706030 [compost metagenome]